MLQRTDIVKFINSLRLRQIGRVERMQNQRMPQKKLQRLHWKEQGKKENHIKDGWMRWKMIEICSR